MDVDFVHFYRWFRTQYHKYSSADKVVNEQRLKWIIVRYFDNDFSAISDDGSLKVLELRGALSKHSGNVEYCINELIKSELILTDPLRSKFTLARQDLI